MQRRAARPPVPWTDAEITRIDEFLMDEANGLDNPLFATEIDGFFCALISGPRTINPVEALRWVFDAESGEQSPVLDEKQAHAFFGLLMKQWNHIALALMAGQYEPLLMQREREDGRAVTIFDDWCVGYMTGVGLDREAWLPLLDGDQAALMHVPMLYGTEAGWEMLKEKSFSDEEHEAQADALADTVQAIHAYWLQRRVRATPLRGPKLGRNDLCHCGSGRKYKYCHGTN